MKLDGEKVFPVLFGKDLIYALDRAGYLRIAQQRRPGGAFEEVETLRRPTRQQAGELEVLAARSRPLALAVAEWVLERGPTLKDVEEEAEGLARELIHDVDSARRWWLDMSHDDIEKALFGPSGMADPAMRVYALRAPALEEPSDAIFEVVDTTQRELASYAMHTVEEEESKYV